MLLLLRPQCPSPARRRARGAPVVAHPCVGPSTMRDRRPVSTNLVDEHAVEGRCRDGRHPSSAPRRPRPPLERRAAKGASLTKSQLARSKLRRSHHKDKHMTRRARAPLTRALQFLFFRPWRAVWLGSWFERGAVALEPSLCVPGDTVGRNRQAACSRTAPSSVPREVRVGGGLAHGRVDGGWDRRDPRDGLVNGTFSEQGTESQTYCILKA